MAQDTATQPQGETPIAEQPQDMDLDITRTFSLLLVTLVLPVYLALSVVSFSMAAIY